MENHKQSLVIFDVDGTLITYDNVPRYDVINIFNLLQGLGCVMAVWSGGGKEYAENWVRKLGLKPDFVSCKFGIQPFDGIPDIAFDDEIETKLGKVNIYV